MRAKIARKALDQDAENHERIKMLVSYDDDRIEEVVSYNTLCDIVAEQHEAEANGEQEVYTFNEILECKRVKKGDPDCKGSSWSVLVQ